MTKESVRSFSILFIALAVVSTSLVFGMLRVSNSGLASKINTESMQAAVTAADLYANANVVPRMKPKTDFFCLWGKEFALIDDKFNPGSSWKKEANGSYTKPTGRDCNSTTYKKPERRIGTFCNGSNQQIVYYAQNIFNPGAGWNETTQPGQNLKHYHFDTGERCIYDMCVYNDHTGPEEYTVHSMPRSIFAPAYRDLPVSGSYRTESCPAGETGGGITYYDFYQQTILCIGDEIGQPGSGLREYAKGSPETKVIEEDCVAQTLCTNDVMGYLDSVQVNSDDDTLNIVGWSCSHGCASGSGNTIHVYARDPGSTENGTFINYYQTNWSTPQSNSYCGIDGNHAFNIDIPLARWQAHAGKELVVVGAGRAGGTYYEQIPGAKPIPEAPVKVCTGTRPVNTVVYGFDEAILLPFDMPWKYSSADTSNQCEFGCKEGYEWDQAKGSCVLPQQNTQAPTCTGPFPANAQNYGWGDVILITEDTPWTYSSVDTPDTHCQFRCNDGYQWNGSGCISQNTAPPIVSGQCLLKNYSYPTSFNWVALNSGVTSAYVKEGSTRTESCSGGRKVWWDTKYQPVQCVGGVLVEKSSYYGAYGLAAIPQFYRTTLLEDTCPVDPTTLLRDVRYPRSEYDTDGILHLYISQVSIHFDDVDPATDALESARGKYSTSEEWHMIQKWEEIVDSLRANNELGFGIWAQRHPMMAIRYFARAHVRGLFEIEEAESMIQIILDQQGIARKNGNSFFVTNYDQVDDVANEQSPGDFWKIATWQQESNNDWFSISIRHNLVGHDGGDVLEVVDFEGFQYVIMVADYFLWGIPSAVVESLQISEGKDPGLDTVMIIVNAFMSSPLGDYVIGPALQTTVSQIVPAGFFDATTVTLFDGVTISVSHIITEGVVAGVRAEAAGGSFEDGFKQGLVLGILLGNGTPENSGILGGIDLYSGDIQVNNIMESLVVSASLGALNGDSLEEILENSAFFVISETVGNFTEAQLNSDAMGLLATIATDAILTDRDPKDAVQYFFAILAMEHARELAGTDPVHEIPQDLIGQVEAGQGEVLLKATGNPANERVLVVTSVHGINSSLEDPLNPVVATWALENGIDVSDPNLTVIHIPLQYDYKHDIPEIGSQFPAAINSELNRLGFQDADAYVINPHSLGSYATLESLPAFGSGTEVRVSVDDPPGMNTMPIASAGFWAEFGVTMGAVMPQSARRAADLPAAEVITENQSVFYPNGIANRPSDTYTVTAPSGHQITVVPFNEAHAAFNIDAPASAKNDRDRARAAFSTTFCSVSFVNCN